MNVANRGIIRKLTMRFLTAGKTRNIIAVIAIALTSIMFTSIFTLGGNMLSTVQENTMRQVGTSAHGGLKYLTMEQYRHFAQSLLIKNIAYRKCLAVAENELLAKEYTEISYAEDRFAGWGFSLPSSGNMPRTLNEIAASTIVLDALGVPHQIGAQVPLEFSIGGVKYNKTFTLCGYWPGDPAMMAQQVWVSEEYVDSVVPRYEPENDFIAGAVMADLWFDNAVYIEGKMLNLIKERGFADGEINFGVNWAYAASGDIDPTAVAIIVLVLALILFSGYLIIYSIFVISVNSDIHFYGLLKTIGTTGKQLRKIIRTQALVLSAFGIPVGLLFGYIAGIGLSPLILNIMNIGENIKASANPLIFIFAALFSLLTVFFGCRKPAKIAASVSPVEAVKYSGVLHNSNRKTKKTQKVTPLSMAWANITREKRKLIMIVISLSLALILLNSAVSAIRSFDMDMYLSNRAISDFSITDASVLNPIANYTEIEGIKQDFLNEIAAHGITETGYIYYDANIAHKLTPTALKNLKAQFEADFELLQRYYSHSIPKFEQSINDSVLDTQIYGVGKLPMASFYPDYDRLASGNYALTITGDSYPVYDIGDTITLTNRAGETREFEIIAVAKDYPHSIDVQYGFIPGQIIVLPDNTFIDFFKPQGALYAIFNVPEDNINEVEAWLAEYTSRTNPALAYVSRETLKAEFDNLQTTYLALGGAMSFILALIGILNFVNAIVTSIIARRRELAMLQSVGMTGRQIRSTLFFEGLFYTTLTAFFTLTAGLGLSWLIVKVMAGQTWFFKQNLTVLPSALSLAPLLVICAVVPLVCYAKLNRDSLVERLRIE